MRRRLESILFNFSILVALGGGYPCFADESEGQVWIQLLSQGKMSERLRLWGEVQPRYSFSRGNFSTLLVRPALGWQINSSFTLWAGYAWTPLFNPTSRDEHRLWSQATFSFNFESLTFANRIRIESRFIGTAPHPAYRLRYLARLLAPFSNAAPLSFVIYDEVFFALNSAPSVTDSGFDQNRLFFGIHHRISPDLSWETGYVWNAVNRPGSQSNRTNHVLGFTLFHYFDFNGN